MQSQRLLDGPACHKNFENSFGDFSISHAKIPFHVRRKSANENVEILIHSVALTTTLNRASVEFRSRHNRRD